VAAGSQLVTVARSLYGVGGQAINVTGTLLPRVKGRIVSLQGRLGGAWRTLARARTADNGHFTVRWTPGDAGGEQVRLRFAGDRVSRPGSSAVSQVTILRESVASWYSDGGTTACGFHAGLGVANRTLPCGTRVTFRYGGRTVVATVDDRGPFVGGRDWDLNQNTAAALGFGGVDAVLSSM
jgi:hypothetical protein